MFNLRFLVLLAVLAVIWTIIFDYAYVALTSSEIDFPALIVKWAIFIIVWYPLGLGLFNKLAKKKGAVPPKANS